MTTYQNVHINFVLILVHGAAAAAIRIARLEPRKFQSGSQNPNLRIFMGIEIVWLFQWRHRACRLCVFGGVHE